MEFLKHHQLNIMLFLTGICWAIAFFVCVTKNLSKNRKRAIFLLEVSSGLLLAFDRLAYIYSGNVSVTGWWMVRITNFSVYFFSLTSLFAFNLYLKDLLLNEGNLNRKPLRLKICAVFLLVGILVLIFSQFVGLYYTFDSTNHYKRAPGYLLCCIFPFAAFVIQLECIIQYYKRFPRRIRIPVLLFALIPIIATIFQIFLYGLSLTNIAIVGMAIFIYVFAIEEMNDTVERAHRLEIELLEKYKRKLELTVTERTQELIVANEKVEHLLLNILPKDIAQELSEDPNKTISKKYPNSTVLFTDIVDFTKMSSRMSAEETVVLLNKLTSLFDERAKNEGIEKIKTIGDSYMAATGLSERKENDGAVKMIRFARGLLEGVKKFNETFPVHLKIRVGLNTGELVAGVIGKTKFIYDVWGDTVNVASRMESTGKSMQIHVSESTFLQSKDHVAYTQAEKINVKGKGFMNTYYVE